MSDRSRTGLIVAFGLLLSTGVAAGETVTPVASSHDGDWHGEFAAGAGYFSDDVSGFGRYPGPVNGGVFPALDFDIARQSPFDDSTPLNVQLYGRDLGWPSREAGVEIGVPGVAAMTVDYDEIRRAGGNHGQSPFLGAGSGTNAGSGLLTLPTNWQPSTTTAGFTALPGSLRDIKLEQARRRLALGFSWRASEQWKFAAHYQRERKEGNRSFAAVIGNTGGNPRAVLIPEPVDYQTDEVGLLADYRGGDYQLRVGLNLSWFDNNKTALRWQNPYAAISGWDSAAGFPTGEGQAALPPDNHFQQILVGGGIDLSAQTRLSSELAIGRARQDEPFLPYTVNPALLATITQPLPRASLDGVMDSTVANVRFSARPGTAFHYTASYRFDDRDSNRDGDEYVYIAGDSAGQNTSPTSSQRRYRHAFDYREQTARIELGYRPLHRSEYRLGYLHRQIERSASERRQTREDELNFSHQHFWANGASSQLKLLRANREGESYIGNEPFLSSHAPGYTDTVAGGWENLPGLRRFHLADRQRNSAALQLAWAPDERWQLGVNTRYTQDDYWRSEFGLDGTELLALTLDSSYTPNRDWQWYGFLSFDSSESEQNGRSFTGTPARLQQAADPTRNWQAAHYDRSRMVGAGFSHQLLVLPITLGADVSYVDSDSRVEVSTGSALSSAPLPEVTSRLRTAALYVRWQWQQRLTLRCQYGYESYTRRDWALAGVAPDTLSSVLLLGEDEPDYHSHGVVLAIGYRF